MAALATQLEQLKLQQEELEKRIQEEEERKKKLNNEASIERLEELVKPITEYLDNEQRIVSIGLAPCRRRDERKDEITNIRKFLKKFEEEDEGEEPIQLQNLLDEQEKDDFIDMARDELMKEKIYITLIGILKKQDEKIIKLEKKMDHLYSFKYGITGYTISAELANFLGKTNRQVSRTEVTREINTYIRNNNLFDPQNKRRILADLKLKELLKLKPNDELTYYNLQKYLSPLFVKN
jgi:chromatin remodeling complex protein RSC6